MNLAEWTASLRAFADSRDWGQHHTGPQLALALCGEAGEVAQLFRWPEYDGVPTLSRLEEELADVLWFTIRLADVSGVDLEDALSRALVRNSLRFPVDDEQRPPIRR